MTRQRAGITLAVVLSVGMLVLWVASRTSWEEIKVPMPPKGEALVNPFYATQRFAERLGATTSWDRMLTIPPADAVVVVSGWHWSLNKTRRVALQQWVDAGGRLIVDDRLIDPADEFEEWTGIARHYPDPELTTEGQTPDPLCRRVDESTGASTSPAESLWLCDLGSSWLTSETTPVWALRDTKGIQAVRVPVGRGSVTVINAAPFLGRALFNGDHGRVFAAASSLRRGDRVHFISEDNYPSLLALTWRYGAPAVMMMLALVAAFLWRGAVRFGPLAPPTVAARRSLSDQIRGTGRFTLRHGGGEALHTASVRALDEAARRRITGYSRLTLEEQVAALARVSGFDRDALAAAVQHPARRTAAELRRTLLVLEGARRDTLVSQGRLRNGTD